MATAIEESVLKERLMALLKESDLTTTTGEPSEGGCALFCCMCRRVFETILYP
jgi:hypothetical protein